MVNRYHRETKIPEHIVMTLSTLELYKDVKYCNYIVPRSTANTRRFDIFGNLLPQDFSVAY